MPEANVHQSNIDEVGAWIREIVGTFDFLVDVGSGILAEDVRDLIAEMIRKRSINFKQGADVYWVDNERKYKEWKEKTYGVSNVGELTGQMLSLDSLKGNSIVTPDSITMYYGIGQPADRFKNAPIGLATKKRKARKKRKRKASAPQPTDTEKGVYFTEGCEVDRRGRKQNRPPRPFYELDPQIEEAVFELIDEHLSKLLEG